MVPRRVRIRSFGALVAAAAVTLTDAAALAHSRTTTFGDVGFVAGAAGGTDVVWTVRVRVADLAAPLGLPDGAGEGAVLARAADAAAYVAERLSVAPRDDAHACPRRWGPAVRDAAGPSPTLRVEVRFACPRAAAALRLRYDLFFDVDDLHSGFATVAFDAEHRATVIFRRDAREVVVDRPRSLVAELRAYVALGVEHIFTGYDHLAFLAALLIGAATLRPRAAVAATLRIVTAFTAAHSLTLVVAALRPALVPTAWVEPAIAASVCWVAVENLRPRALRVEDGVGRHRWVLAFAFGLVHGFGFASVLREIGLPSEGLVACLLAFNVGVELGQLAVVALVLPALLLVARRAPRAFRGGVVVGGSLVLAVAGAVWFVARVR